MRADCPDLLFDAGHPMPNNHRVYQPMLRTRLPHIANIGTPALSRVDARAVIGADLSAARITGQMW